MKETRETVVRELELSDEVMYGDLLRFYTPNEDWEPIDHTDYSYEENEEEIESES